jgi:hypothetical protein
MHFEPTELPEFDQLLELAQADPAGLEQLRVELCERVIKRAPEPCRRKLRGLQFRIDMQRRKARSHMAACITISGMMHDAFDQLRESLHEAAGLKINAPKVQASAGGRPAKVLPFRPG